MKHSLIIKRVTFKLFSAMFTLIMQTINEKESKDFIFYQVLFNLLTNAFLSVSIVTKGPNQ